MAINGTDALEIQGFYQLVKKTSLMFAPCDRIEHATGLNVTWKGSIL